MLLDITLDLSVVLARDLNSTLLRPLPEAVFFWWSPGCGLGPWSFENFFLDESEDER